MKSRTCRLLGLLMLACATVGTWFAVIEPSRSQVELDQEIMRMRQSSDELDRSLDRQRVVSEMVATLQCRRTSTAAECTTIGQQPSPNNRWNECRTTVEVNGLSRSRTCSSRQGG